jgi:photosystem II stability/assembly factor-like uncharacterized protein
MILRSSAVAIAIACLASAAPTPELRSELQSSGVSARLRGISAVSEQTAWASGARGTILRTVDGGRSWQPQSIQGTELLDFRDIDAMSERVAYALSIGPGQSSRIYKTSDGGTHWDLQFANTDPELFLDAMAFWDADRGVAVADSIHGAFVILTTVDGGRAWTRVPANRLPPALPAEGAFAASGTNVTVNGREQVWIATGAGRVLRSIDGGRTWTVAATPFPAGESSGIFSIAFQDTTNGVVVGGDYRKETEAVRNIAITTDGGLTWKAPVHGLSGYRSVVAYVPGIRGAVAAAGPSGVDWSSDGGATWTPVAVTGLDTLSFARGTSTGWGAGDHGRLLKIFFRP